MFVRIHRSLRDGAGGARAFRNEAGELLRIPASAHVICKWHNAAQGPVVYTWRKVGRKAGTSR
jgi:hypothetical protein